MFLLGAENTTLSSYVEGDVKKNSSPIFMGLVGFSRTLKSGCFFGKFTVEQDLKLFSGRNNSLKPPVFGFSDSFPFGLEESRE